MARSIFSSSWHSVAELKPRLTPQARIQRHVYRGQVWYVVQDQAGGKYHRLSPEAYSLVEGMDGVQTVQALWEKANTTGNGDACTQNEVVDLLVQMHAADLLLVNSAPDSAALFERYNKKRRATLKQWLFNPMSIKLPLIDPDGFLSHWAPSFAWMFSLSGFMTWLAIVLPALFLAGQHWSELTNNLSDNVLSSSNLMVMALVFPAIKLLHELGHGFATKVWGGAVHEMGLMFLVFAPVPYVDASSSAAFPSKYKRAIVAAAGMMTELLCAAIAMYVWLFTEPGVIRAIAFNTMVVAGVSTIIVNGNPLLRYDGYYIFTDLIEIPNLAQRGQKYLTYLWDRYVFGAHDIDTLHESKSERKWLFSYTPLAWVYRTFITVSIILFIAGEFFIFGVILALWGGFTLLIMPLWKAFRHVANSPNLRRRRKPAVLTSFAIICVFLIIAFVLPMPLYTKAEGVVWLPEQALLRAGGNGIFDRWIVPSGKLVAKGSPLYLLKDELLQAELSVTRAKVKEAEAKYAAEQFVNPAKSVVLLRQLEEVKSKLIQLEKRADNLVGYAKIDGIFIASQPQDMLAKYYKKGELIGYVLERNALLARVVVSQDDIGLVRTRLKSTEIRMSNWVEKRHATHLVRQSAGGQDELPSAALSLSGGGSIATNPNEPNGTKTINLVFVVDVAIPADVNFIKFGERVYVRFHHGYEPLGLQGLHRLRQLLLSRFSV